MKRFTNGLVAILERLVTFMIAAVVVLVVMQIFMRYVMARPLSWTEQISRYLFVWMMMLGIPIMFHRRIFMAFDLVLEAFPEKPKGIMYLIMKISICAFSLFWFKYSLDLCVLTGGRMTAGVRMPLCLVYGAQPVSALFIFIVMLNQLLQDIRKSFTHKKTAIQEKEGGR